MSKLALDHRTSIMLRSSLKSKIISIMSDCLNMLELDKSIIGKIAIAYDDEVWASSDHGTLVFNHALALLPLSTIRSVVLHELTHLIHGEKHSVEFIRTLHSVDRNAHATSVALSNITPFSVISDKLGV